MVVLSLFLFFLVIQRLNAYSIPNSPKILVGHMQYGHRLMVGNSVKTYMFSKKIVTVEAVNENSKKLILWNKLRFWLSNLPSRVRMIKSKEFMVQILEGVKVGLNSLINSFREGDRGNRGEELLSLEFLVWSILLFGLPDIFKVFLTAAGLSIYTIGVVLLVSSIWELRNCLSLFVTPTESHTLVTTGAYSLIRHPMYGGISFMGFGSAIASQDIYKLLSSILLVLLFNKMATEEEQLLHKLYPMDYSEYFENKYKLIALFH